MNRGAHLQRLLPRHHSVLRLAFEGWKHTRIAAALRLRRETVSRIVNSPLAQAELDRLHKEAERILVDVPGRVALANARARAERGAARVLRRAPLWE